MLAIALLLTVIFMAAFSLEASDSPLCSDEAGVLAEIAEEGAEDATCFESSLLRIATVAFGWGSVVFLGVSVVTAIVFAATTRHGSLLLRFTAGGIVLGALSILAALID